jgi:hypothetical protein
MEIDFIALVLNQHRESNPLPTVMLLVPVVFAAGGVLVLRVSLNRVQRAWHHFEQWLRVELEVDA